MQAPALRGNPVANAYRLRIETAADPEAEAACITAEFTKALGVIADALKAIG